MSHIAIIGGGASGVLAALHILARDPSHRITIVEPRPRLGAGLAYGDSRHGDLLNLPHRELSAFADAPGHFTQWLRENAAGALGADYVPRKLYGHYLEGLIAPLLRSGQVDWRRERATELRLSRGRCILTLGDSTRLIADHAVLATGSLRSGSGDTGGPPPPEAAVLILGTGLSMADQVLHLLASGHEGRIFALSRHGLLPQRSGASRPLRFDLADLPLGASAAFGMRWLRAQVCWHQGRGAYWRDVVDGLGDAINAWWQSTGDDSRSRFLRHARRHWMVHRHRLPGAGATQLEAARQAGQLVILKGQLAAVTVTEDGQHHATIRNARGQHLDVDVAQVIDCRGVQRPQPGGAAALNPEPLIRSLLRQGIAASDPFGLGLKMGPDGAMLNQPQISVMGALRGGRSVDAGTIRNIRAQAKQIADSLALTVTAGQEDGSRPGGDHRF